jgi:hypothetical protein
MTLSLKNHVNVASKNNKQKEKKKFIVVILKVTDPKIPGFRAGSGVGSGSDSGSVSQRYDSADPYQYVTNPQH